MKITQLPNERSPHCCDCGSRQHQFDEIQHAQHCDKIAKEQEWTFCRFCVHAENCNVSDERIKAKERYQREFRELSDQFRKGNPHLQSTVHINELAALCYQIADRSGWHETTREFGTLMMLVVTEIAEAFQAWRDPNHAITDIWFEEDENGFQKPEGVGVELADAIIRILDHATIYGIEIKRPLELKLKYNMNRSYRHGGKRA